MSAAEVRVNVDGRLRWGVRVALVVSVLVVVLLAGAQARAAAPTITEYAIPVPTTPYGVAAGPDGKIWFVDSGNHVGGPSVGRMSTSGAIAASDVVSLPQSTLATGIVGGPDGNLWLGGDHFVDKVPVDVTATSQITPYAFGNTNGANDIVAGADGRLWLVENQALGAITTGGIATSYPTSAGSGMQQGIVAGPDGKLWFGENDKIVRMSTAGVTGATDVFTLPAGDGYINGLVAGPDGNVWFSLGNPAAIGRITPVGAITLFATPTAASLPFGLAAGPDGRIWFVERNADKIGAIPTTATSGADITEYPVAGSNVGLLHITAGADGRMWFQEFNQGSLGAITTGAAPVTPPPTAAPGEGPPSPGVPLPPASPATAPLTAAQVALQCTSRKLALINVRQHGGHVELQGAADRSLVGKTVQVVFGATGSVVARATVRSDGSFAASAPLPAVKLRATDAARYRAVLGAERSLDLKLFRRMIIDSITSTAGHVKISGRILAPLGKPQQKVTVSRRVSCHRDEIAGRFSPHADGSFSVTVPAPPGRTAAVYRLSTQVRKTPSRAKLYPTFTLPVPVTLA